MLQSIKEAAKKISFLSFILFAVAINQSNAQDEKSVVVTLGDDAIENLKNAITSENPGLRKSGIYLSGKHAVKEVSGTLLEQLSNESDPDLKILIIRVLYIIDENEYMDEIYRLAVNEKNDRVRRMASAIYSVMQINGGEKVVQSDN